VEVRSEGVLGTTAVAPHRLRWSRQLRRVTHSAVVVAGAVCVVVIVLVAAFAGAIAPHDPDEQNFDLIEARPSAQALFGTHRFGRDVLSRVFHCSRISV
jgi:ABC-type dipeptide/oligopeptide/nickel transport system permease subunit